MFCHNNAVRGCGYHSNRLHTDYVIKVTVTHTAYLRQKETHEIGNPYKRSQIQVYLTNVSIENSGKQSTGASHSNALALQRKKKSFWTLTKVSG
ncbi:hypothetical protein NPIL_314611 [Nephila pilipes]|uniref:Uncharacterized protein n=1 Tax=Nephila pilipes TaxID=299642 RepID=A0A8X6PFY0_NEPPI|nr:hypothetical protein NPIL_314611 [Nephila pilipes]